MLDVTDLEVLGLVDEIDELVNDSGVLFFLGMAPVFLFGSCSLAEDVFVEESNTKLVTVEEGVEPDGLTTAVVDIFGCLS